MDYLVVFALGAIVGSAEIVSRYRDAPFRVIKSSNAIFYILINAAAASLALYLIKVFGWDFGIAATEVDQLRTTRILVAGFGSMALFRSALFNVRIGDEDIGVGPSGFLQVLLMALDREVDRNRGTARAEEVEKVMGSLSYAATGGSLMTLCLALMQNLPKEEQQELSDQVNALNATPLDDRIKTLTLGLKLMNVVGVGVLRGAVKALGPDAKTIHSVRMILPAAPITPGSSFQPILEALDQTGAVLAATGAVWASDNSAVATVDATSGLVSGVSAGRATITATLKGKTGSAAVVVQ